MINEFQNTEFLKSLYGDKDLISFRGEFMKKYSDRKFSLRSFIIKFLSQLKDKAILDIGCGNGSFLDKLNTEYPNNRYFGLDIAENIKCKDLKFLDYRIYDGKSFPDYQEKFDVIFCMHTMYHVEDFNSFFVKIKNYIKPNGIIVITTKSKFTFPKIESIFMKIVDNLNLKIHININKFREESRFCLENGLKILKKYFAKKSFIIDEHVIETKIIVDNKKDLLKYIFSTNRYNFERKDIGKTLVDKYLDFWKKEIDREIFIDNYIEVVYLIKNV